MKGIETSFHKIKSRVLSSGLIELIISNMFIQLTALVTVIFLADLLDPKEIGFFRLLFAYFVFFQMLGLLGCNSSILKFCSENIDDHLKISRLLFFRQRSFVSSLLSSVIFNIYLYFYVDPISASASYYMHIYTLSIPFAVYSLCSMALLQSLKMVRTAAITQGIIRASFLIFSIIGGILGGLEWVIYMTFVGYILGAFALFIIINKSINIKSLVILDSGEKNTLKFHSYGMFFAGILGILQQNIDFYMLGFLGASYSLIASFGIAAILFNVGTVITGTIQTVVSPFFSENQDNKNWVRKRAVSFQLFLIPISLIFGILMYFGLYALLKIGFFNEYQNILKYSVPVIFKYFIWSTFCILGAALFSIGVVKETLIHALVLIILNIILSYFSALWYGIEFIIYIQPIIVFIQLIFCLYLFNRKTKVEI